MRLGGRTDFENGASILNKIVFCLGSLVGGMGGILKAWAWVLVQDFRGHDGQSWIAQAGLC